MKVRLINHVNYTEYADVEVKDKTELDKLLEFEYGFDEEVDWIHGKDYGETTHEILNEEVQDEKISD
jgi:hypothetical protein